MTESICADITCKLADKGSVTIVDSFGNADNEIRSFSKLFFYLFDKCIRKSDDPYILEFGTADVNEICNKEKAVPEEWITKDGSDIGDEFIAYACPLIQGSVEVPMKDGLPYFAFRK